MAGTWQASFAVPLAAEISSREFKLTPDYFGCYCGHVGGAAIIEAVRRWRNRPVAFRLSASDQLAHFRSLYDAGELSEEEFNRLQAVLAERIKKELDIPAVAAAPAAPQSSPTSDSPASATETSELPATGSPPSANGVSPPSSGPEDAKPQDPPSR